MLNIKFTKKQKDIITRYYPIGGSKLCQEQGLYLPSEYIRKEAHNLGLKVLGNNIPFYDWEIQKVMSLYQSGGAEFCQECGLGHRTKKQIDEVAQSVGFELYKE